MLAVIHAKANQKGKGYRVATQEDADQFCNARQTLKELLHRDPDIVPSEAIPVMSGTFNAPIYGLDEWGATV